MGTNEPFVDKIRAAWPPADWQDVGVLVAVSGGADSVALVRALAALKTGGRGRLAIAHFNHRWRGAESDDDCAFVARLAGQLSLDCVVGTAEPPTADGASETSEAAAREARYAFLQQAAEARGDRFVVTAHTRDDQAETVLFNILRGAGLAGVAGIARTRPLGAAVTVVRPLLDVSRSEVLDYLAALGQAVREDVTNRDLRFGRNRIRHEILPQIVRGHWPGAVDALVRLSKLAADVQRVVDRAAESLLARAAIAIGPQRAEIDCQALRGADRHVVREMFLALWRRQQWPLQDMGFVEWQQLADMALAGADSDAARSGERGKRDFPGAIGVERVGERLILCPPPGPIEPAASARSQA
jgi:tRNA(Ile)-lysidine synthase